VTDRLISVVIPAFNEARIVTRCLTETVAALESIGGTFEVILVDDGSSDGTADRAREAADVLPRVRVIGHEVNLGKGSALARGAMAALGSAVLFVDADLEVHPRQLTLLLAKMESTGADVVIGSKLHRDSKVDVPRGRHLLSVGYYVLVRTFFRLPVHDTQTGLKLFRREPLLRVLPRLLVKRFAHDLEVLVNVHRLGYRIEEVPVVVTRTRPFPRLGWHDVWWTAWDTAAIWYRTYLLRYYDRIGPQADAAVALALEAGALELEGSALLPGAYDRQRESQST
jgi:dolichol-phosphate mannosyltransferase